VTREEFLARVASALGRPTGAEAPPPPGPPTAELVSPTTAGLEGVEALVERFRAHATALGVRVLRAADDGDAVTLAAEVARDVAGRTTSARVVASGDALAEAAAAESGLEFVGVADADVGLTAAWRAVAETGTVVLRSESGRLAGLLPPAHVVLLRERDLRRSLVEVYDELGAPPSALVQVTGPSRTADIEMTLTTGVHGPGTVVVVLVGDGTSA
jgi:L-lactate dehydrogenase complex protein LldG